MDEGINNQISEEGGKLNTELVKLILGDEEGVIWPEVCDIIFECHLSHILSSHEPSQELAIQILRRQVSEVVQPEMRDIIQEPHVSQFCAPISRLKNQRFRSSIGR